MGSAPEVGEALGDEGVGGSGGRDGGCCGAGAIIPWALYGWQAVLPHLRCLATTTLAFVACGYPEPDSIKLVLF